MLFLRNLNMISLQGTTNLIYYASQMNDPAVDLVRVNVKHPASSCSIRCQGSSSGKGAGKCAPRPFWAYRGAKQSEKAGMAGDWSNASHPVGKRDGWGGQYVPGGYEIQGQFFPLPGFDWFGTLFMFPTTL